MDDVARRLGEALLAKTLTVKDMRQAVLQARGELDDERREADVRQQLNKLALATKGLKGAALLRGVRRVVWYETHQDGAGI